MRSRMLAWGAAVVAEVAEDQDVAVDVEAQVAEVEVAKGADVGIQ